MITLWSLLHVIKSLRQVHSSILLIVSGTLSLPSYVASIVKYREKKFHILLRQSKKRGMKEET